MDSLIYVAAAIPVIWGLAHIFAGTRGVVAGFGELTTDNRRIITMEWIVEGLALVALGAWVAVATAIDSQAPVSTGVYIVAIAFLVAMTVLSLFTGFRIRFVFFRLCPFLFMLSAILIALGEWL
jgi:hypothetical protein